MKNVYLIGMMGSGKTTVGQLLAQELNYRFFDTDVLVKKKAKKSIREIFDTEGEAYFRELETDVLKEASNHTTNVIATGGGIIQKSGNWDYLHRGSTVWLNVDVEILRDRLLGDNTRPLLPSNPELLLDFLKSLLEARRGQYDRAADLPITIDEEKTPEQIADEIMRHPLLNRLSNVRN